MNMSAGTAVSASKPKPRGYRRILLGAVLGSGVAFLDTATVNIALPSIQEHLGGGLAGIQWVINAYLLTVGALLLYGGALGDIWGWGRAFRAGLIIYSTASFLCAFSPNINVLIAARAIQGIGAALLLPSSLPLATANLEGENRDRAIGLWTSLVGVGAVIGPFVGGWLIDLVSWRAIFLLNLPLTIASYLLVGVQGRRERTIRSEPSVAIGGLLIVLTLGGMSFVLIEGSGADWSRIDVFAAAGLSVAVGSGLIIWQRRASKPIIPVSLIRSSQFVAANLLTTVLYGAVNVVLFVTPLFLQKERHISPFGSAAVIVPVEIMLVVLSPLMIRIAIRIGPWLPLVIGPLICAVGCGLLAEFGWRGGALAVLLGIFVFSIGFAIGVAPLNSVLLGSVREQDRGVAFGVNNAVARIGGLLSIAVLPLVSQGVRAAGVIQGSNVTQLFGSAAWFATALCLCSVACGMFGLRNWKSRTQTELRLPG